jgi:hypothetical protein
MIVAAGLFVIGVTSESDGDTRSEETTAGTTEHNEAAESAEARETEGAEGSTGEEESGEDEERVLGVDVESPRLVTTAVVVSLLLAGLVWRRPTRAVLIVIAVVAAVFAVLDAAEVAHQLDEDNTGLALLAGLIAAVHVAVAALSIRETTAPTDTAPEPVTAATSTLDLRGGSRR